MGGQTAPVWRRHPVKRQTYTRALEGSYAAEIHKVWRTWEWQVTNLQDQTKTTKKAVSYFDAKFQADDVIRGIRSSHMNLPAEAAKT